MKIKNSLKTIRTFRVESDNAKECHDVMNGIAFLLYELDMDQRVLTISGDIRKAYRYSWGPSENQTLTDVLKSCAKQYLLDKLSERTIFNLKRSQKALLKLIDDDCIENLIRGEVDESEVRKISDLCREKLSGSFSLEKVSWVEYVTETIREAINDVCPGQARSDWDITYSIPIENDYPDDVERAVDVFIKYVRPILKDDTSDGSRKMLPRKEHGNGIIEKGDFIHWHCPGCDLELGSGFCYPPFDDFKDRKFCKNCGTKLDWDVDPIGVDTSEYV